MFSIKKQVPLYLLLPFMLLGIYLFQILNIGYFTLFSEMYFKGGLIYLVLQSLALIFLNHNYSLKKRSSRIELAKIEEESMHAKEKGGRPLKTMVLGRDDIYFLNIWKDEVKLEKLEQSNEKADRRSIVKKFIMKNLMKGAERRLTIPHEDSTLGYQMSKQNIRRIKSGYRHPFERIPESFFGGTDASSKKKIRKGILKKAEQK